MSRRETITEMRLDMLDHNNYDTENVRARLAKQTDKSRRALLSTLCEYLIGASRYLLAAFLRQTHLDLNERQSHYNPLLYCYVPYDDMALAVAHVLHYDFGASALSASFHFGPTRSYYRDPLSRITWIKWLAAEKRAARACVALLGLRRKKRSPLVTRNVEVSLWEACVVRRVWATRTHKVWEGDNPQSEDAKRVKKI